jgi:superfamily II DNA helicase RecQ
MPFSLEETKEILQKVFLPENAQWYPVQHEYLDKILPAESNILVALPTGGGKSLLFQGPALYRSSFTNRLTIVVTPLKALNGRSGKGPVEIRFLWQRRIYQSG